MIAEIAPWRGLLHRVASMVIVAALLVVAGAVLERNPAHARPLGASDWPSPAVWPTDGAPRVLSDFAPPEQNWQSGHRGVDLAAAVGQPVRAAAAGRVSFAGVVANRGVVVVSHGRLRTTYQPVTASVAVGTPVVAGSQIGTMSAGGHCTTTSSANATPSCLHWGLLDGDRYLDPTLLPTETDIGEIRLLPATSVAAAARVQAMALSLGSGGPVDTGPPGSHGFVAAVRGPITSRFGPRFHPVLRRWKLHDGTDYGAGCGTPLVAAYDGVVRQQYFNVGYGNRLIIDHGVVDGVRVTTAYNHAMGYNVSVGQRVRRGQQVGRVGTTGYSTGCHLHFMVWLNGALTNPERWL